MLEQKLAKYAHDAWSGWMRYLFDKSKHNKDGSVTIPKKLVTRWTRQMLTKYSDLSKDEQQSDIAESIKIIEVLGNTDENLIKFDTYLVKVKTSNYSNDFVWVDKKYYKCTDGFIYITTNNPKLIYDILSNDNIISIEKVGIGYNLQSKKEIVIQNSIDLSISKNSKSSDEESTRSLGFLN